MNLAGHRVRRLSGNYFEPWCRAEYSALGHARHNRWPVWGYPVHNNPLPSACEERPGPGVELSTKTVMISVRGGPGRRSLQSLKISRPSDHCFFCCRLFSFRKRPMPFLVVDIMLSIAFRNKIDSRRLNFPLNQLQFRPVWEINPKKWLWYDLLYVEDKLDLLFQSTIYYILYKLVKCVKLLMFWLCNSMV